MTDEGRVVARCARSSPDSSIKFSRRGSTMFAPVILLLLVFGELGLADGAFGTGPAIKVRNRASWPWSSSCNLRASLNDRPEEVAKVRSTTRRVVNGLLQEMVQNVNRVGDESRAKVEPGTMKSAKPLEDDPALVLGFLGSGVITRHVVTGICRHSNSPEIAIVLSPRNSQVSAELAATWPGCVTVASTNQQVVDSASIVCVAVLPAQCEEVLRDLKFRADHAVLSFVSTSKIAEIQRAVAPAATVVRAIPMPPISKGSGPFPMYPRNEHIAKIFADVGTVITLEDETEFSALMSASAIMAPFYHLEDTVASWIVSKGVGKVTYTCSACLHLSVVFGSGVHCVRVHLRTCKVCILGSKP